MSSSQSKLKVNFRHPENACRGSIKLHFTLHLLTCVQYIICIVHVFIIILTWAWQNKNDKILGICKHKHSFLPSLIHTPTCHLCVISTPESVHNYNSQNTVWPTDMATKNCFTQTPETVSRSHFPYYWFPDYTHLDSITHSHPHWIKGLSVCTFIVKYMLSVLCLPLPSLSILHIVILVMDPCSGFLVFYSHVA